MTAIWYADTLLDDQFGSDHAISLIAGAELRGNKSNGLFSKRYGYDSLTGNTIKMCIRDRSNSMESKGLMNLYWIENKIYMETVSYTHLNNSILGIESVKKEFIINLDTVYNKPLRYLLKT